MTGSPLWFSLTALEGVAHTEGGGTRGVFPATA